MTSGVTSTHAGAAMAGRSASTLPMMEAVSCTSPTCRARRMPEVQVALVGRSGTATVRTRYHYTRWRGVAAGLLLLILFSRISDLPSLDRLPVSVTQTVVGLLFGAMLFDRLFISRKAL